MQPQRRLADRSYAKRKRRTESRLETAAECEGVLHIRGGLSRPGPPHLGPPPNRATRSRPQANTPRGGPRIVDDDNDTPGDDWRRNLKQQPCPTSAVPPANVQLPTPQASDTSNQKQRDTSGSVKTAMMAAPKPTAAEEIAFAAETEVTGLFDRLQEMVAIWVEECLPDTFPQEFQTDRPESYWELCGWAKPMWLGATLLDDGSWAKFVYESWVWRFLHQHIFRLDSLAWAGGDETDGGLYGTGPTYNDMFSKFTGVKGG
jgi:hypothetical protein